MKRLLIAATVCALALPASAKKAAEHHGYPIDPVPFTSVKVNDTFWGQRLKASREVTIPSRSANVRRPADMKIS